jgi:microcystin-dependent protein
MFFLATAGLVDGTGKGTTGLSFEGWAVCNGNNGTPNMLSPDLNSFQGRVPLAAGGTVALGGTGGAHNHALTSSEITHTHSANTASNIAGGGAISFNYVAPDSSVYTGATSHNNLQPYIGLNFLMYIGYASY